MSNSDRERTCPYCGYTFHTAEDRRRHLEEGSGCPEEMARIHATSSDPAPPDTTRYVHVGDRVVWREWHTGNEYTGTIREVQTYVSSGCSLQFDEPHPKHGPTVWLMRQTTYNRWLRPA